MYFAVLRKNKIFTCLIVLLILMLLITFLSPSMIGKAFNMQEKRSLPIYRVDREDKKIAISFDCAWGTDYTDKLLNIMQEENIKCTFFAVEFWTKKHPDYIKKISDFGHEIGTHSSSHPHMSKLDKKAIENELNSSKKAIEEITGKKVELFRAPYGEYNNLVIETAKELELFTIQWDVDSLDWKDLSSEEISKRVISKVKSGSIVLFHNQGLHTAQALRAIIQQLRNQGYEFVSIGELIYRDNFRIQADGTQIKNN